MEPLKEKDKNEIREITEKENERQLQKVLKTRKELLERLS